MQSSKLYVGNLDHSVTSDQLTELFSNHGTVSYIKVIEGKGFGFVEMSSQVEAEKAKGELNGFELEGRLMRVNEARPQKSRGKRGGRR